MRNLIACLVLFVSMNAMAGNDPLVKVKSSVEDLRKAVVRQGEKLDTTVQGLNALGANVGKLSGDHQRLDADYKVTRDKVKKLIGSLGAARAELSRTKKLIQSAVTPAQLKVVTDQLAAMSQKFATADDALTKILNGEMSEAMIAKITALIDERTESLATSVAALSSDIETMKSDIEKLKSYVWRPGVGVCMTAYGFGNESTALLAPLACFMVTIKLPVGELVGDFGSGYGGNNDGDQLLGIAGSFGYGFRVDQYEYLLFSLRFRGAASKGFTLENGDRFPTISQFLGVEPGVDWDVNGSGWNVGLGVPLGRDSTLVRGWEFSWGASARLGYQF